MANATTNELTPLETKITTPEASIRRADTLDDDGRTEEAIALLQEIVERWPEYVVGWSRLSALLCIDNRHHDALAAAHCALTINPRDVCALIHGGRAALQLGDLILAKTLYERLIEVAPNGHRILYLAEAHALLGEHAHAAARAIEGIAQMDDRTPQREQRLAKAIALLAECAKTPADLPPDVAVIARAALALMSHQRGAAHHELRAIVSDARATPAAQTTANVLLGELWRAKDTKR